MRKTNPWPDCTNNAIVPDLSARLFLQPQAERHDLKTAWSRKTSQPATCLGRQRQTRTSSTFRPERSVETPQAYASLWILSCSFLTLPFRLLNPPASPALFDALPNTHRLIRAAFLAVAGDHANWIIHAVIPDGVFRGVVQRVHRLSPHITASPITSIPAAQPVIQPSVKYSSGVMIHHGRGRWRRQKAE